MKTSILKLIEAAERCLLPKLAKSLNETEIHPEIVIRDKRLEQFFPELQKQLEVDLRGNDSLSSTALSSLFILYKELQSDGPWNTETSKEYLVKLDQSFRLIYEVSLDDLLSSDHQFNVQEIFDELLTKLHWKLTSEHLKMYPSLIEVYCSCMENMKKCKIKVKPAKSLPIALLLMDDYVLTNKLKGLGCCKSILHCLTADDFSQGNYYEVIYTSLKTSFLEKDLEATTLACECLMNLLALLPNDVQIQKADVMYSEVLHQILTEANLYRKSTLFKFTTQLITILKVECVKWKMLTVAVCDNLDACCSEGVSDVLLLSVLDCYEEWLKHCWCIWSLHKDQKQLQTLFKVLFVCKTQQMSDKTVQLIITLTSLCTKQEMEQIIKSLERSTQIKSEEFNNKVNLIKHHFVLS